ncbi:MAG: 23S rRNA methyltransferase [Actinobacteria bacterium]|nr:23S rRNA methyltransferase [Actinomycetota bacterium]
MLTALRCPVCRDPLSLSGATLRCERGHAFDVARQGYVNLRTGGQDDKTADTAAMVAARDSFLRQGHYEPVAQQLGRLAARADPAHVPGLVADLAGGTGYYLSHVLGSLPHRRGLCIDLSAAALRRAARAHPRAAAVGSDVWRRLPLADGAAALVVSVFGPRNIPETERVLAPGGVFLVATPTGRHLREPVAALGLLRVDQAKPGRLAAGLARFAPAGEELAEYQLPLGQPELAALVAMGPSARHLPPPVAAQRIGALPSPLPVTISVRLAAYRRP